MKETLDASHHILKVIFINGFVKPVFVTVKLIIQPTGRCKRIDYRQVRYEQLGNSGEGFGGIDLLYRISHSHYSR